jgi:hypothetical protein
MIRQHVNIMRASIRFAACGAAAIIVAATASPAHAAGVTFAQYNQVNGGAQQWSISATSTTTTVSASGTVDFTFSGVPGAPVGPQVASFLLSAMSTTPGTTTGNAYSEAGFSGSFSFIDTALPAGMQNLLSGIFQFVDTGAQLNESMGGTGGGFGASDTAINLNEVVMTSSYINFIGQTLQTSTFTLSSLIPAFSAGGVNDLPTAGPYAAAGVGTFSSNPGFAPEPGSIFLIGGGLIGLGVLSRKKLGARS